MIIMHWLSNFQCLARYNKWNDSMCLANVIFYLTGTAKCWLENFEEILNSWEEFKINFCEIFGNKDTARKAENILRTRAQMSGENAESYVQEVLLLCKQSNPGISEGEMDISTVDQFVGFCRQFEALKRMRVAPPRFNRLPNVTTISTAEPENMEALIRRIRKASQENGPLLRAADKKPIVTLVRKKDCLLRFCVDYRRQNKITKKDVYPLPRIDDALDTLTGSRYFSTMDMRSGYWQIEVDDKDRKKTPFITPDGLHEFNLAGTAEDYVGHLVTNPPKPKKILPRVM
ncbi:K02A2.6-like [Cordylochernes scorpioides]|uniref:K02A2.6-like n=1 Tax=Cordylochernes scorpioides TaxID=51811 RepID=A0ABY6LYS1_9ARAC|nr:K02A2.6-like [Cordylochernes scorpioides]